MYDILPYTKQQAKKLGVSVYPSKRPKYKIDVFDKNNNYITSCGDSNYLDYPTYILNYGKAYADKRRELYWNRHKHEIKGKSWIGSRSYYSLNLLW